MPTFQLVDKIVVLVCDDQFGGTITINLLPALSMKIPSIVHEEVATNQYTTRSVHSDDILWSSVMKVQVAILIKPMPLGCDL